jgi:hypothetical protein
MHFYGLLRPQHEVIWELERKYHLLWSWLILGQAFTFMTLNRQSSCNHLAAYQFLRDCLPFFRRGERLLHPQALRELENERKRTRTAWGPVCWTPYASITLYNCASVVDIIPLCLLCSIILHAKAFIFSNHASWHWWNTDTLYESSSIFMQYI